MPSELEALELELLERELATRVGRVNAPRPKRQGFLDILGGRLTGSDLGKEDPLGSERLAAVLGLGLAGGTGGAVLGGGTPVSLPLALLGGGVGAVAGAVAPEMSMAAAEKLGLIAPGTRKRKGLTPEELRTVARGEGLLDVVTGGGFAVARPVARSLTRTLLGAKAKGARKIAERTGLQLAPIQVTKSRTLRAFTTVASAFPFASKGFRDLAQRTQTATGRAIGDITRRFAPVVSVSQRGLNILSKSSELVKGLGNHFDKRYAAIRARAIQEGASFDPTTARPLARKIIKEETKKRARRVGPPDPATGDPTIERIAPASPSETLVRFLENDVSNLVNGQTFSEFDGLVSKLDDLAFEAGASSSSEARNAVRQYTEIRKALVNDLHKSPNASAVLRRTIAKTDDDFSLSMKTFETPTAKIIGRVRRKGLRGFVFDKTTTEPADKLYRIIFDTSFTPQTMRELKDLVGAKPFKELVAGHIDDVARESFETVTKADGTTVTVFNPQKFEAGLGLSTPTVEGFQQVTALEGEALKTAFRLAKLNFGDAKLLINGLKQAWSLPQLDPAQLVKRRLVLGGVRAGLRSLLVFSPATGFTGGLSAVAAILSVRSFGNLLSSPTLLRTYAQAATDDATAAVKGKAALEFLRFAQISTEDPEVRQVAKAGIEAMKKWAKQGYQGTVRFFRDGS